jgi:hypothetical protein
MTMVIMYSKLLLIRLFVILNNTRIVIFKFAAFNQYFSESNVNSLIKLLRIVIKFNAGNAKIAI